MQISGKELEQQLSAYSFWEFYNEDRKAEILTALQHGKINELTIQKRFVPANEVDQYIIMQYLSAETRKMVRLFPKSLIHILIIKMQ